MRYTKQEQIKVKKLAINAIPIIFDSLCVHWMNPITTNTLRKKKNLFNSGLGNFIRCPTISRFKFHGTICRLIRIFIYHVHTLFTYYEEIFSQYFFFVTHSQMLMYVKKKSFDHMKHEINRLMYRDVFLTPAVCFSLSHDLSNSDWP